MGFKSIKKELVVYLDAGIIGTFVHWERHPSEEDYRYLHYVPIDSRTKTVIKYEKPIRQSAIHNVDPVLQLRGVPDRIIYVYTGEDGSIAKQVMNANYIKELEELRAKNKSLEMKNAALTQEVENARSGVSKAVASARSLARRESEYSSFGGGIDRLAPRPHNEENFDSDW